ncbi:MAG: U32 family peptidase C-terminal domain-containing protein [Patescibacteria group bacterium]|nr:U32 family peptidase C-terminal domain-containing protein [Patescibacteria group bacterium]
MKKDPELILPAADLNREKYAFQYGADAVYGGLPNYSLRKAEVSFTLKTLEEGIEYAHSLDKKFYVTLNIFPKNSQIKCLGKEIKQITTLNPDAFIISDPGLIQIAKKLAPKIPIHLSTQANSLNYETIKFWKKQGIKRVVLARELTLKEISEIKKKVPEIELECFVHGAMCISYSGRCLMSAFMTGRESNQGLCTQPCRWQYKLHQHVIPSDLSFVASAKKEAEESLNQKRSLHYSRDDKYVLEEAKRPDEYFPIEEDDKGTYIMNSKDLCLIEHLEVLKKAGVSAFKIEGRNKSEYYVGIVARAYRKAIEIAISDKGSVISKKKKLKELRKELETINYRDYTTGFLFGKAKNGETYNDRAPIKKYEFVGVITERKDELFKIEVRNKIESGKEYEFITPEDIHKIKIGKFYNLRMEEITEMSPGNKNSFIFLELPELPIGTLIRKKLN